MLSEPDSVATDYQTHKIPPVDLEHLVGELYVENLMKWSDIKDHLPILVQEVTKRPSCRVLELGVRTGVSTSAFIFAALQVNGVVESVDINPFEGPEWLKQISCWKFTRCSDLDYKPLYDRKDYDVLFIDTSHYYNHTMSELLNFVPYVKSGGVVLCHDTLLEQVGTYDVKFPVAKALTDYCSRIHTDWNWTNDARGFGMGILHIP